MNRRASQLACLAASLALAAPVPAHDCRVLGNGYLRGSYEGDCEEKSELAHGQGEAKGADSYVGSFVKGRLLNVLLSRRRLVATRALPQGFRLVGGVGPEIGAPQPRVAQERLRSAFGDDPALL